MIRIDNVKLYTGETCHSDGCVLVDESRILYAGDHAGCPAVFDAERIDGRGGILMPGFYNAHAHAAMTLERGVGSDLNLMDWLGQIFPIEDKLDGMKVYWGTMLAIQEMLRRGVVAFADMYFFMDYVARAALEAGIRLNLCRGCTSMEGLENTESLFEEFDGAGGGLVKVYVGLHSEYLAPTEVAVEAAKLAKRLGTGIHVHVSETKSEVDGCVERHGVTPPKYLSDLGLFDVPALAAHCVHLTDEDIALLTKKGVWAVHNPASNLKLASGVAPVAKYLKAGMRVALGTDGPSSNNILDMMGDMRLAALLQKGVYGDPTLLNAQEAIYMATRAGALALGFADCGLLKKDMRADMILLDGRAENLMPAPDLPAAIVYGAQSLNVKMTMIDGRVVYKDGKFLTINPERVTTKAREAATAMGVVDA